MAGFYDLGQYPAGVSTGIGNDSIPAGLRNAMAIAILGSLCSADRSVTVVAGTIEDTGIAGSFANLGVCVVPCDPAEACSGRNRCAPGYISQAPYFACGTCDAGYYRASGRCEACPALGASFLLGVGGAALLFALLAYAAYRLDLTASAIIIVIDFLQVSLRFRLIQICLQN
jgi:hypothetical protein